MDLILSNAADILLILATLGAGTFCLILSRRLTRLSRIDNGLGGAIAVLSAQVDDMSKALAETRSGSEGSATRLEELNAGAQRLLEELELTMSACHDLAPPEDARPTEAKLEAWDIEKTVQPVEPVVTFGSRRHPPEDEKDDAIPLFLQKKSRLAEIG